MKKKGRHSWFSSRLGNRGAVRGGEGYEIKPGNINKAPLHEIINCSDLLGRSGAALIDRWVAIRKKWRTEMDINGIRAAGYPLTGYTGIHQS